VATPMQRPVRFLVAASALYHRFVRMLTRCFLNLESAFLDQVFQVTRVSVLGYARGSGYSARATGPAVEARKGRVYPRRALCSGTAVDDVAGRNVGVRRDEPRQPLYGIHGAAGKCSTFRFK
jgi:hypothetical protein